MNAQSMAEKLPSGQEPLPNLKPELVAKMLMKLEPAYDGDGKTLLGKRFLCRGSGMVLNGATGIGKSTAVIQMGICWAVGKEIFGIPPSGPLKILYIQAENDEGDLCEMRDGVLTSLGLTADELALLDDNFVCVMESSRTGKEFINDVVAPLLKEHSPDLVIIDPALSYLGGSANEQETVGGFLRNQLNPMLQDHWCGALIVHHTTKPNADRDGARKASNAYAYTGAGSAEWANWPRAVLFLEASTDDGVRTLRLGKRERRLGWVDGEGKATMTKYLKQSNEGEGIFYRELTDQENILRSSKTSQTTKVLLAPGVLPAMGGEISKETLIARIAAHGGLGGLNNARSKIIPMLLDKGYLEEKKVPRSNGPPEKWLVRTKSTVDCLCVEAAYEKEKEVVTSKGSPNGVVNNGVINDGKTIHN